jgi:RimJ/RimL family protein N-acetyltransferase
MSEISIETDRLLLRRWKDVDLSGLASMNQDPIVMKFIGPVLTKTESESMISRADRSWSELGYGRFAVELIDTGELIGFVGLAQCKFDSHFTLAVEVGWRLARRFWNLGYATEGARAVMGWAFESLEIDEVVSFTSASNLRSRRVMEKIGMQRNVLDDFLHPNLNANDPLRPCVLYRKKRAR